MAQLLKQSTAFTFRLGPFLDSGDGFTAETGLTLSQADFRLSKAGGAFAQKNESTSGTHDENGYYTCILNTTDTNTLGTLDIHVNESGALPVFKSFMVVPAIVWDSLVGGTDLLDVSTTQFNGSAVTQSGGRPEVNVSHFGGSAGTFASGRPEVNTTLIEGSDATNQIRDAVVDDATRIDASALNTLSSHDPGETIMGATDLGTGAGLTTLATQASVNTIDGIVDAILIDTAEIGAAGAGLTVLASAAALATVDGNVDTILVTTNKMDDTLEDDGGTFRFTANALEEAPSGGGGGLDAAGVRAALGFASASYDTDIAGLNTNINANETKIDTIDTVLDALVADIGSNGAGLTAIPWNSAWDAEVQSECTDALNAYDPPTRAELTTDTNSVLTAVGDVPTNAELATALGTADDAVLSAIAGLPTANQNADALLDRTAGIETSWTLRQGLRIMLSVLAGKASGLNTTTAVYRDMADSKDRISATVDVDGNRTAVTRDAT